MDIGKAFRFAFEDEEWVSKLLLGTVFLLIPVVGMFFLIGYGIAVIRRVMADDPQPLPAWDDVGRYFTDGLMYWVATLVYALPLILFLCPIAAVWILPMFGGENEDLILTLGGVSGVLSAGLGCLALLYVLFLNLVMPVVQIRFAETGEIGACLRVGEIMRFLFDNIGRLLMCLLVLFGIGLAIGLVVGPAIGLAAGILSFIPICGPVLGSVMGLLMLPVSFWLSVLASHLYGQVGRLADRIPLVA